MATLADLVVKVGIDGTRVSKGVNGIADKVRSGFDKLDDIAGSAIKTMAGMSSVIPIAGGLAAGALSVGAGFAAAGAALGVFKAVATSAMAEVKEAVTQTEALQDKIDKYGAQAAFAAKSGKSNADALKAQAKATEELQAHLASLPPDVRAMTESTLQLKSDWQDFVDQNKPAVYGLMTRGYKLLGSSINELQPFFDAGRKAAGRFLGAFESAQKGGFLERLAARAGPALDSLTTIILNVGRVVANVFGKLGAQSGQGFLEWLEQVTAKWVEWATAPGENEGLNKLVATVQSQGPGAVAMLASLATAAMSIAQAVAPLAPITMAVASALAALVAAVPADWITAIVAGFIAYNAALKLYALYTGIATAAQWAMNSAVLANPLTWIIVAIVAVIAAIVLLATKTQFFQTVWKYVWGFMKGVGAWFAGPFANFFVSSYNKIVASLQRAKGQLMTVINTIKGFFIGWHNKSVEMMTKIISKGVQLVNWFRALPGRIGGALRNVFNGLWTGFRSVANKIISGWNNLSFRIGGGSVMGVSIPSVTLNTPNIPYLAEGGIVTGPTLAMIGEGRQDEAVIPLDRMPELSGRNDDRPIVVEIAPGGEREFRRWIQKTVRVRGSLNGRTREA